MPAQTIDVTLCTDCGLCVKVCKSMIYTARDGVVTLSDQPVEMCLACGQCAAACPTGAITVKGAPVSEYSPEPPPKPCCP